MKIISSTLLWLVQIMAEEKLNELKPLIEAALYIAGRPLNDETLSKIFNTTPDKIFEAIQSLKKELDERQSALEIIISPGPTYSLQLRSKYVPYVQHLAPGSLFSTSELKTLSLIAIKQPVKQSEIAKIRGSQAYSHIKKLTEHGFLSAKKGGRTKILATTRFFSEYFGLPYDKRKLKLKLISMARREKLIKKVDNLESSMNQ